MRKFLLFFAFLGPILAFAQTAAVTGVITDEVTTEPAAKAEVRFITGENSYTVTTDEDGRFAIDLPSGVYQVQVKTVTGKFLSVHQSNLDNNGDDNGNFEINADRKLVSLGGLYYKNDQIEDERQNFDNIPTVSLSETDGADGGQNISSSLNASRDVFVSTATFVFSNARFRIRGYEYENFTTYMNGVPVNDLEDGGTYWGMWGGLNNVMLNRETNLGLQASTYTFGGIGGSYALDSRASKQRKQLQVSYATTNRNYRHRLMATYSTGMLKRNWAVSMSVSRRWADEGYVPGTFYDGYSYFLSVEKRFTRHSLSLTAFGTPTRNGRSGAAVQEMYDIAGSNYYNPYWGYQQGRKRNANVGYNHQPMFILTHEWNINPSSHLLTSASFSFGERSTTALDWNNASDPRPDYYRYLPSYQEDTLMKAYDEKLLRDNEALRQIQWDKLYEANFTSWESIDSVDGIPGNIVSGKRARYIVEKRVESHKRFNFATTYNNTISDHVAVTAGLTYQMQMIENFKRVDDLLGADFYVDVNQFAMRDFPDSFAAAQNDLNHPNRILKQGDKFGYDYVANIHRAAVWGQGNFKFNHFDFFLATELSAYTFWREGKTRMGLFPNSSYGKSDVVKFFNYAIKGGVTYKIDGRNYLYANGAYLTRAPYFENAFVSSRTRNTLANDLQSEKIGSAEMGYQYRSPVAKVKATFFFSQFQNQTKTMTYYHGDYRTLVNYTLTGIDTRHWGFEFAADVKVYKGFSLNGVASIGRYTYISRPDATVTQDNSETVVSNETVYAKNFNVGGSPQLATSFGINYRDPKFWFINLNFNYYDWMWLDFNPTRRTEAAVEGLEQGSEPYDRVVNQERLKGQFIMNIFAGYSWLLNNQFKDMKRRHFLVFSVGVNNVTNNKKFITGGYEQLRYDYEKRDPNSFPSKYYYSYGTTYFISMAYRFQ